MEFSMEEEILKVEEIYKKYGKGQNLVKALDGVSFDVKRGEIFAILGSSGSGKSTLLNIIGGMCKPDSGKIWFEKTNICEFDDRELTNYRKKNIGFVFQSFNLINELTVKENIMLTANFESNEQNLKNKSTKKVKLDEEEKIEKELLEKHIETQELNLIDKILQIVSLTEKKDKYIGELSGGEQQRVSIARALAKNTNLLLCDEPTGALDYKTGKQILIELERLARDFNKTIVIVTHTREIEKMADRAIFMRSGKIIDEKKNLNPVSASKIEW